MMTADEERGAWVATCGGRGDLPCGATIYQKNLRYVAYGEQLHPLCAHGEILCGEHDLFGPPTVTRELGWCGCGASDAVDWMMLAYLRSRASDARPRPEPEGVGADAVILLAYMAGGLRWTDHGTMIDYAWLTDAGREALTNLERLVAHQAVAESEEW